MLNRLFNRIKKEHSVFNSVYVAIAVIAFWRGLWGLLDVYVFPNQPILSYAISALVGMGLLFINDFKLEELE